MYKMINIGPRITLRDSSDNNLQISSLRTSNSDKMWKIVALALISSAVAWPSLQSISDARKAILKSDYEISTLEKNCKLYGGDDTYSQLKSSYEGMLREVNSAVGYEIITELLNRQVPNLVSIHCGISQAKNVTVSLHRTLDLLKSCMNPKYRDNFQSLANLIDPIRKYGCGNKGAELVSFIKNGGVECLFKREEKIERCMEETIPKPTFGNDLNLMVSDLKGFCQVISGSRKCIINSMNKCQNKKSFIKFAEGFFNTLKIPACH